MKAAEKEQLKKVNDRLESGALMDQRCWSFIKELNSYSEERLESVAVSDGFRQYTYRQMFHYWERYAEAFSAVNMTGKNRSRVALIGTPLTETTFAFYGLNMTGASVSLIYPIDLYDEKQIRSMIEREKITDLLISELYAFPQLMKRLFQDKEELGLRNIILLESPMGGEYAVPALEIIRKVNRAMFREISGGLLMEELLKEYEAAPITHGNSKSSSSSVILHTTGTISGMHKPVPMSDKAMNSFVACAIKAKEEYEDFKVVPEHMISCLTLNMSWVYSMVDMLHMTLGLGMELVCLPLGGANPRYGDAIEHYGVNVLFTSKAIFDSWIKTMPDVDLSELKVVFMGGGYVSPEFKRKFNGYLESCGSTARIINGYGLSELGGACIIAPSEREDDAIGFLLPGFKARIFVEDENRFYDLSEGPRTGVLFLSSPTMSSGRLGNNIFFKLNKIGEDRYFNTNDLVRLNDDGSLTCIGRSNQFFVNNKGVRFDAGLVENAVSSQPGIVACGLAPEYHKTLHDSIPVLYAETNIHGLGELDVLRQALIQVFIRDGKLADTNMPGQCVLTDSIPLNTGGKVDSKKLASGTVIGKRFQVKPVKLDGQIIDILLLPAAEGEDATMGAGIPEELEDDPYTILSELFAAIPDITKGRFAKVFRIPGLREMILKLTDFDIRNIPGSMRKMAPKLMNLAFNHYSMPMMKGEIKMSDKMNPFKDFMPMFQKPPMPFMPDADSWGWFGKEDGCEVDCKNKWEDFKSNMETFWEQMQNMRNSALETSKGQWNKFFAQCMEMQETFAASLPEETSSMPGMPVMSPKAFMEKIKKFQEMANAHFVEQADSFFDFCKQGDQQVKEMVSEAIECAEAPAEEASEKKPKERKNKEKEADSQ